MGAPRERAGNALLALGRIAVSQPARRALAAGALVLVAIALLLPSVAAVPLSILGLQSDKNDPALQNSASYRTGRADVANQKIQEWLKQDPRSADAYVAEAWRLRQEKAYPLAQTRLQQALSIDAHNRRALTELAILYEAQGMPDLARVQYERILERDPHQIEVANRLNRLRSQGARQPQPD